MPTNFAPVPGTSGSVVVEGYEIPCRIWTEEITASSIPCPTVACTPFVDILPGFKTCKITFSGTTRFSFNPFVNPLIKINTFVDVKLYYDDDIFAESESSFVSRWDYANDADGLCTFACELLGDFEFNDFGGNTA